MTVAGVEKVLQAFMREKQCRDLDLLIKRKYAGMTWETSSAGHTSLLMDDATDLWAPLFDLAPSACLLPKVTTIAVESCNSSSETNFTNKNECYSCG